MGAYPNLIIDEDINDIVSTEAPEDMQQMNSSSPYIELTQAMKKSGAICKPGYGIVNKLDRVCRVSLFPINDGKEVAFVFSLAHLVADRHIYYKVLSMFVEG